jgi:hypothetical protein
MMQFQISSLLENLRGPDISVTFGRLAFGCPIPFRVPSSQLPTAALAFSYSSLKLSLLFMKILRAVIKVATKAGSESDGGRLDALKEKAQAKAQAKLEAELDKKFKKEVGKRHSNRSKRAVAAAKNAKVFSELDKGTKESLVEALGNCDLFQNLNDAHLTRILDTMALESHTKGTKICRQGVSRMIFTSL